VQPGDTRGPEQAEDPSTDERAEDAEDDVEQHALAVVVYQLARDEAGDEAENDPSDDGHGFLLVGCDTFDDASGARPRTGPAASRMRASDATLGFPCLRARRTVAIDTRGGKRVCISVTWNGGALM